VTWLGLLNFLLLQWLGVRLQVAFQREALSGPMGRWWSRYAPARPAAVSWSLLRWVWPLTGWWSDYRWIARRW
jgi:hypothetical protein